MTHRSLIGKKHSKQQVTNTDYPTLAICACDLQLLQPGKALPPQVPYNDDPTIGAVGLYRLIHQPKLVG